MTIGDKLFTMLMKFVEKILADSFERKPYRLAKQLEIPIQTVNAWLGKTKSGSRRGIALHLLCKLRRVSGLSWSEFGRLLDAEFGD